VQGSLLPIAGALVELQHREADEFWNIDLEYGQGIDTLARTQTDADGRFRFDVERARQHRLQVTAIGFAPMTVLRRTGGAEVLVEMSRGADIDGVVRCEGKSVVDADVRVVIAGEDGDIAVGRTDAGGAFHFAGLQAAKVYVQVRATHLQQKWEKLDLVPGQQHHLEIDLEPGKVLRGRVLDAHTSIPIADAEVSDSWTFRRAVRSDGLGCFELPGLPDQDFVMCQVRAPGYASAARNVGRKLDEAVEFRLTRGGSVIGRIVDEAGLPVCDVYAAVCASYQDATGYGLCDLIPAIVAIDGRFHASGLRPDQHYWILCRAHGFGSRVQALPRLAVDGEQLDVGDIVLRAAGGIEGRVVDDHGAGSCEMRVSVSGASAGWDAQLASGAKPRHVSQFEDRSVVTDHAGRFRITALARGSYRVSVRPSGHRDLIHTMVTVEDGVVRTGVELVVPAGQSITGTLAYPDGRAMTGSHGIEARSQGKQYSAEVDGKGAFRFGGLAEGAYDLSMMSPPKGWSLTPRRQVPAGATDLRLIYEPASFVSGRVVDANGAPAAARVLVYIDGVRMVALWNRTDDEGRFRIEVPPGFVGVVQAGLASDTKLEGRQTDVVAGQSDVQLVLQPRQWPTPAASRR
jgi:hypothetical protein